MGMMKPWHWIVLIVVILIVFGAAKLPHIAKSIGQSAKVLKKEIKELQDDVPPEIEPAAPSADTTHTQQTSSETHTEK